MVQQPQLALLIEKWCSEAFARWGDDWARISEYVQINFTALSEAERSRLTDEATLTLLDPSAANKAMH